ncbi:MAG: ABC-F family ATP-binding cassette domain-containing protein [Crocinitomicaceae bacterium]|nr:ABC-F family ATP-binding cassette domain-containing protein [Crocinitomicaceae bacterium]MBK8925978.1 ABC-F family ATP-binding cassette domain-containing protein [Crocinitomicaceae bacterium]
MNYLSVENLTKSFGVRVLFKDITFGLNRGDKVAFVAKNGSGKSTLLKILCGIEGADSGNIVFRNDIRVDYLQQAENFNPDKTILEEILSADTRESKAIKAYQKALENPENGDELERAGELMNSANAWDYDVKIDMTLSQLKIDDKSQKIGTMSGGQKKRLALAKILINEPDIMILDEPTNHLDLDMIEWLEAELSKSKSTIIMVTHDRYFLEVICNTIFEMNDQTLYRYNGNFSYYLEKKAEREDILQATISKAKNLMRTELDWIRRQPKARGTKQKARVDAFDDLKEVASQKIKKDQLDLDVQMSRLGSKIVEFHHVGKRFGEKIILRDFSYVFKRGEKIGIVGNNGTGKSTFLNLIAGAEIPDSGKINVGETVVLGYYHQDGMKFKDDQRVIEIIKEIAEFIPLSKGRTLSAAQFLEKFLFPRDMHYNLVEKLSGGEKKRLYLMTILMKNPNFLILDEPTNDLDIFVLSVLEDYLSEFDGCLLVVSHDRYFMDKMAEHTFYFSGNGEIKDILGNYTVYRSYLKEQSSTQKVVEKKEEQDPREASPKRKLSYKEKSELESLEKEMEKLQHEKASITELLSDPNVEGNEITRVSIRLAEIESRLEIIEMRWLELSELDS